MGSENESIDDAIFRALQVSIEDHPRPPGGALPTEEELNLWLPTSADTIWEIAKLLVRVDAIEAGRTASAEAVLQEVMSSLRCAGVRLNDHDTRLHFLRARLDRMEAEIKALTKHAAAINKRHAIQKDMSTLNASQVLKCPECWNWYPALLSKQCARCLRVMCPVCADSLMRTEVVSDHGFCVKCQ